MSLASKIGFRLQIRNELFIFVCDFWFSIKGTVFRSSFFKLNTLMKNKILKWAGAAMILLFLAAFLSSCSSTRKLGCPMKITSASHTVHIPVS